VIDEAHEIFAGLHKRYGRDGLYDEASDEALMAHRVRSVLRTSPVLLLTATPMQNSLAELWGLVQYVEPTGTLLGDITTFRQVFCADDDRTLVPGQEHELQRRLGLVLQRTLRRQAQGVSRPSVHSATLPLVRVRDEQRRAVALRRRDRVSAAAVALRVRR
jgi:SNF2 family DNA or RNA helicase